MCNSFLLRQVNKGYFRSTFIASRYNYILNKECIKGEDVEKVFSGSRVQHD